MGARLGLLIVFVAIVVAFIGMAVAMKHVEK
jgi:hypothetical protein